MPGPEPSSDVTSKYGLQSGVESKKPYAGFKKATGIGPDPQAERFKQHPILNAITKYVTGVDLDPNTTPGMMDFLAAGMPFFGKAFHGTTKAFQEFNPELYNKSDILGSFTHFSPEAERADQWAKEWKDTSGVEHGINVIPANLDLKNTLDLTRSDIANEDLTSLSHYMNEGQRSRLQAAHAKDMQFAAQHPHEASQGYARDAIIDELTNDPMLLQRAGFDGVHYIDYGGAGRSLAVPTHVPLQTPWGTHLGGPRPLGLMNPEYTIPEEQGLYNAFHPGQQKLTDIMESVYQQKLQSLPTNPKYKGVTERPADLSSTSSTPIKGNFEVYNYQTGEVLGRHNSLDDALNQITNRPDHFNLNYREVPDEQQLLDKYKQ